MPDFSIENKINGIVAGVDEVGRGSWAGSLTAGAAIINQAKFPAQIVPLINDSKQLSPLRRQRIYDLLTALPPHVFCYSTGIASVEEIDAINVRQATLLAMSRAIEALAIKPDHCLIDGNAMPSILIPATCVIKGDTLSLSIAAASIIAKVERDRYMATLATQHPQYQWQTNAGYGTKPHQTAIAQHGITAYHRRSFKPIKRELLFAF